MPTTVGNKDGGDKNDTDCSNPVWHAAQRWGDLVGGVGHGIAGAWDIANGALNHGLGYVDRALDDDEVTDGSGWSRPDPLQPGG